MTVGELVDKLLELDSDATVYLEESEGGYLATCKQVAIDSEGDVVLMV